MSKDSAFYRRQIVIFELKLRLLAYPGTPTSAKKLFKAIDDHEEWWTYVILADTELAHVVTKYRAVFPVSEWTWIYDRGSNTVEGLVEQIEYLDAAMDIAAMKEIEIADEMARSRRWAAWNYDI